MLEKTNQLGVIVTLFLYVLYILMFGLRLAGREQFGHWLASLQFLSIIAFIYLLFKAPQLDRPFLYILQISLMLLFLLVEFILDYLLKLEFRQIRWAVISYVIFFFAATGGLLGLVSAVKDRLWTIIAVILFLIMAVLAFISRAVAGI